MKKLINLAPWCGVYFDIQHGALLHLPDAMADDRLAAGLVRLAEPSEIEALEPFAPFEIPADEIEVAPKGRRSAKAA